MIDRLIKAGERIADAPGYYKAKEACASGAPLPVVDIAGLLFPNPSNGTYNISMNGIREYAQEVVILNAVGNIVFRDQQVNQVNISNQPAGVYIYRVIFNHKMYTGRLIKL